MSKFLITVLVVIVAMVTGCSDPYSGTQQPVSQPLLVSGDTNAGRLASIVIEGCTIKASLDGVVVTLEAQAFKMNGELRGVQTNLSGLAISIDGLVTGPYEVELSTNGRKIATVGMDVTGANSCELFSITRYA